MPNNDQTNVNPNAWYVVLSKPKQEGRAKEHLEQQGADVFLPEIEIEKIQKGRKISRIEPLFPGYVFVNFNGHAHVMGAVRSTRGARGLLRFGLQSAQVPAELIDELKAGCIDKGQVGTKSVFKLGDKVHIKSGPFKHCEAVFSQYDGDQRAIVLLTLLQQQQTLTLDLELVSKQA